MFTCRFAYCVRKIYVQRNSQKKKCVNKRQPLFLRKQPYFSIWVSVQYRLETVYMTLAWSIQDSVRWTRSSCFHRNVSRPNVEGGESGGESRIFPASCIMFPGLTVKVGRVEWRWTESFLLPVSCFRWAESSLLPVSCFRAYQWRWGECSQPVKCHDLKEKNVLKRNTSKTVRVSGLFEHICVAWCGWRVAFYLSVFFLYITFFLNKKNLESRRSLHFWDCNLQVHLLGLSHGHRLLVGQIGHPVNKEVKLYFCIAKGSFLVFGAWVVFLDRGEEIFNIIQKTKFMTRNNK